MQKKFNFLRLKPDIHGSILMIENYSHEKYKQPRGPWTAMPALIKVDEIIELGNRHTLCRRFGKGLACVGPSGRQNLPTIMVYQPTAGMNRVTIV